MKKTVLLSLGTFLLVASGCGQSTDDGVVELELFSNKTENISTYQQLIEEFESEHEGIRIRLNSPPDAETLLRTRLVKDDMPILLRLLAAPLRGTNASEYAR